MSEESNKPLDPKPKPQPLQEPGEREGKLKESFDPFKKSVESGDVPLPPQRPKKTPIPTKPSDK